MNYFEFIKKWAPPSQYPTLLKAFEDQLQVVIDQAIEQHDEDRDNESSTHEGLGDGMFISYN
jgi:hypothetical protein